MDNEKSKEETGEKSADKGDKAKKSPRRDRSKRRLEKEGKSIPENTGETQEAIPVVIPPLEMDKVKKANAKPKTSAAQVPEASEKAQKSSKRKRGDKSSRRNKERDTSKDPEKSID